MKPIVVPAQEQGDRERQRTLGMVALVCGGGPPAVGVGLLVVELGLRWAGLTWPSGAGEAMGMLAVLTAVAVVLLAPVPFLVLPLLRYRSGARWAVDQRALGMAAMGALWGGCSLGLLAVAGVAAALM